MNFSYGIIIAVGVLVAAILALIAIDPGYLEEQPKMQDIPEMQDIPQTPMTATVSVPMGSASLGCEQTNECFIPYDVLVGVGGTVTWSNDDAAAHTVTSGTIENGHDDIFDSGLFTAGAVFDFTFDDTGTYDYYCIVHPWMVGKVTVS